MEADVMLPTDETRTWVRELWRAAGSAPEEAQLVADHLIGANLAGHDSHGVGMVFPYVRSLKAGELQLNQRITVVTDSGTLLVVEGNRGMGQSIANQTMQLAIERARRDGVAIVGLRNSHHIGRVGHWAEQAIAAGMASIHFTNVVSRPMVSPHGGGQSRFGTNPLTVGLPRRDGPPILLDFASSAIAVGKVRVAYNRKGQAPAGALIDHEGKPTTNPAVMYEEPLGALLTAAGHKGYALAMVCDLLGSALFGGTTPQPSRLRAPGSVQQHARHRVRPVTLRRGRTLRAGDTRVHRIRAIGPAHRARCAHRNTRRCRTAVPDGAGARAAGRRGYAAHSRRGCAQHQRAARYDARASLGVSCHVKERQFIVTRRRVPREWL